MTTNPQMSRYNECFDAADVVMPPLTAASTLTDESSVEEFPLQHEQRENLIGHLVRSDAMVEESGLNRAKSPSSRVKRFSLRSLARPIVRVTKGASTSAHEESKDTEEQGTTNAHVIAFPTSGEMEMSADSQPFSLVSRSSCLSEEPSETTSEQKTSKEQQRLRRVSFSPSTEDKDDVNEGRQRNRRTSLLSATSSKMAKGLKLQRRNSYDGSVGRAQAKALLQTGQPHPRKRRQSFTFSTTSIRVDAVGRKAQASSETGKGDVVRPRVSKKEAIAARHARVLERIINAGTSIELEELKAKRAKKIGSAKANERASAVVQHYPVVAPRKIKSLKAALMNPDTANGIIGELRTMSIDPTTLLGAEMEMGELGNIEVESVAQQKLQCLVDDDLQRAEERHQRRQAQRSRATPIRAVCLDCTEEEAARRSESRAAAAKAGDEKTVSQADVAAVDIGALAVAIKKLSEWLKPATASSGDKVEAVKQVIQFASEIKEDVVAGDVNETLADTARLSAAGLRVAQPVAGALAEKVEESILPTNKVPFSTAATSATDSTIGADSKATFSTRAGNALANVSPISLLVAPTTTLASFGVEQSGAFDALAAVSAAAVASSQGGKEAMLDIRPPLDRMAVLIHWWGFELTLPEPTMQYLQSAHSVSGAFMGFLQTMVTTGGVPELLPFVRYISSFMDMEFAAIKSQDSARRGVVIAATWLMPLALVPRPWDYGGLDNDAGQGSPSTRTFQKKPLTRVPSPRLPQIPPGMLPVLPVRVSSTDKKSDRQAERGQKAATDVASNESSLKAFATHDNESHVNRLTSHAVLDSVAEMPEGGSIRL